MLSTDVCIIGGGPAGAMAGLRLAKDNIPFILIEKDNFPREKICGDALSGKVPHIIRRLSPEMLERFQANCDPMHSHGIRFIAPGDHVFDVPFIADYDPAVHPVPGFTLERKVFDDFMMKEVLACPSGQLKTGTTVKKISRSPKGFTVEAEGLQIQSKLLIDASGTSSAFEFPYLKEEPANRKTALAVRAYYEGVSDLHPQNFIELYFLEDLLPGYFWIFPLPGGKVNAGIGVRKDVVLKKKLKLSAIMDRIIREHPLIAPRFKNAKRLSKPAAYRLPLGNPRFRISGEGYLLAGDAAHLVDPLTGEGVGNALYSGFIAAEQMIDCLQQGRQDEAFMKAYDRRIKRVLGKEMGISSSFQKLLKHKRMVKWIARRADGNKHIPGLMSSMFTDLNHRKKLMNPIFLLRVLMNK